MAAVLVTVAAFTLCVSAAVAVLSWLDWNRPEDLGDLEDWFAWEDELIR